MVKTYTVQGRNGYWAIDEYEGGRCMRLVEIFRTRKLAYSVCGALNQAAQPPADIHARFALVREHPDFAGGTVFTRTDVKNALDDTEDELPDGLGVTVTEDMQARAIGIINCYIFESGYSWADALRDNIEVS